jgi:hypothetical protein
MRVVSASEGMKGGISEIVLEFCTPKWLLALCPKADANWLFLSYCTTQKLAAPPLYLTACSCLQNLSATDAVCVTLDTRPTHWDVKRVGTWGDAASVMPMGSMTSHVDLVALEQTCLTSSFAAVPVHHLLKFLRSVEQKSPRIIGVRHWRCHAVTVSRNC